MPSLNIRKRNSNFSKKQMLSWMKDFWWWVLVYQALQQQSSLKVQDHSILNKKIFFLSFKKLIDKKHISASGRNAWKL
jgi:hypothetical protein